MHFLFEIFPVALFFIAFKLYGIYTATIVGIIATALQVLLTRLVLQQWDKKQVITLVVFLFFGGMTLYFHNPIFVKWKPTIVFWIFAIAILMTQFFTKKTLAERLMASVLQDKGTVPDQVFRRLNLLWFVFFFILGLLNLYIAYYASDEAWVNFKFYGITGILFVISIAQAFYLMRFITVDKDKSDVNR